MSNRIQGGVVFTPSDMKPSEYLPNKGVFLTGTLGKSRGDAFGLYLGRIKPGCVLEREVHQHTTETIFILSGDAIGLVGEQEVPLRPGQVLHVDRNVPHGLRNAGRSDLEFLVIGHPDF